MLSLWLLAFVVSQILLFAFSHRVPLLFSSAMSSIKTFATASTTSVSTSHTETKFPKKLFIDVSPSTTEHQLYFACESYGPVMNVYIPKDKQTGMSRGFAFVVFRWHEDAAFAIQSLEGKALDGLILHPRWAAPTKKTTDNTKTRSKRNGSKKKQQKKAAGK